MMEFTIEQIEAFRDPIYHRTPERQVRTVEEALDFVNKVGFCFAFAARNSELPCLWHAACGERNPQWPEHTHHDPYVSLVWVAKDALVAERKIYYGKALKRRPTMISLQYFPCFYALSGRSEEPDDYLALYMRGNLSPEAKRIMDALSESSPQTTAELKMSSGLSHPRKRYAFDRAMAELQMNFYVVKIAEFYEPFTFLWELVSKRFADEIKEARSIPPEKARKKILARYFQNVLVSDALSVQRLFGWNTPQVDETLHALLHEGLLTKDVNICDSRKKYFALSSLIEK